MVRMLILDNSSINSWQLIADNRFAIIIFPLAIMIFGHAIMIFVLAQGIF